MSGVSGAEVSNSPNEREGRKVADPARSPLSHSVTTPIAVKMFAKTVFANLRSKHLNASGHDVDSSSTSTTPIAGVPSKSKGRSVRFTLKALAVKMSTKVSPLSLPSMPAMPSLASIPSVPSVPFPSASKVAAALKLDRGVKSSKRRIPVRKNGGFRLLTCCFSPQRPYSAAIRPKDCQEPSLAPSPSCSSEDELISSAADVSTVATIDTRDAVVIIDNALTDEYDDTLGSERSNVSVDELAEAADATPVPELSQSMAAMIQGMSPSFWTNDFDKDWSQLTDDDFIELMISDDFLGQGRAPTALADSFGLFFVSETDVI